MAGEVKTHSWAEDGWGHSASSDGTGLMNKIGFTAQPVPLDLAAACRELARLATRVEDLEAEHIGLAKSLTKSSIDYNELKDQNADLADRLSRSEQECGRLDERWKSVLRIEISRGDRLRAERDRLRAALETLVDADWAVTPDWSPEDWETAMKRAREALDNQGSATGCTKTHAKPLGKEDWRVGE